MKAIEKENLKSEFEVSKRKKIMRKFIVSGFADEFDSNLKAQVGGFKGLGIDYIEVRFINKKNIADLTEEEVKDLKAYLDVNNISVSAVGSPLGKVTLDDDMDEHLKKCERVFKYANILGSKFIRIFSFYAHKDKEFCEASIKEVYDRLEKMVALSEKYSVVLCHENEHGIYGETPEKCLEIFKHFGGRLKCVFDMGNFRLDGNDPIKAYEMLKEYIAYFHLKDVTVDGIIVPFGMGDAKIEEILCMHAKTASEPFVISMEPHLVDFKGLNALVQDADILEKKISYKDSREAFTDAAHRIFDILERIEKYNHLKQTN